MRLKLLILILLGCVSSNAQQAIGTNYNGGVSLGGVTLVSSQINGTQANFTTLVITNPDNTIWIMSGNGIGTNVSLTTSTNWGSSGQTNWTWMDANGWHNTNNSAASQGVNISKGNTTNDNIIQAAQFVGPFTPREVGVSDATSFTPNAGTTDVCIQTNTQTAGTLTVNNPIGSPVGSQRLMLRIKSTNIQTFAWGNQFRGSTDLPLPVTTSGSSLWDYITFYWNSSSSKWDCLGKNFGF